ADFAQMYRIQRWLMGDLDISSYEPVVTALPLATVSMVAFAWLARPLNLLSLGPESAGTRGLDVTRAQQAAFLSASLATGAAVSVGGPVGFVGIIIPHLVRLMVGSDHRIVLPASTLFGAAFLVGCDVVARTVIAPIELPVGIITALIGGPFFLWLLVSRQPRRRRRPCSRLRRWRNARLPFSLRSVSYGALYSCRRPQGPRAATRVESCRSFLRSPKCSSRSALDLRSWRSAASTTFHRRSRSCRRW